jgi:Transposase IS66 family
VGSHLRAGKRLAGISKPGWDCWVGIGHEVLRYVQQLEWRVKELETRLSNAEWLFIREPGVGITNNEAERALRHAVMWRRVSFTAGDRETLPRSAILNVVFRTERLLPPQSESDNDLLFGPCNLRLQTKQFETITDSIISNFVRSGWAQRVKVWFA